MPWDTSMKGLVLLGTREWFESVAKMYDCEVQNFRVWNNAGRDIIEMDIIGRTKNYNQFYDYVDNRRLYGVTYVCKHRRTFWMKLLDALF
jgi:hypothetical protein